MVAPTPKKKVDEMLEKLVPSIQQGEQLIDELSLRALIRDADKLPDYFQRYLILTLCYAVKDDLDAAYSYFNKAAHLQPFSDVLWANFAITLGSKGYHGKAREIYKKSMSYPMPRVSKLAFLNATFWADVEMMNKIHIANAFLNADDDRDVVHSLHILSTLNAHTEEATQLTSMTECLMIVAERHGLKAQTSSIFTDAENMLLYEFDIPSLDASYINLLNDELTDLYCEKNIFSDNCVAMFMPTRG